MKLLKKIIQFTACIVLALVLALQVPVTAFASSQTYISEVVLECGSTAEEAKTKLSDAGYLVYDVNLSTTSTNKSNKNNGKCYAYMYLGYKTTTNPDEALTDIRAMNMDGGYSETEYKAILEQKNTEIGVLVDSIDSAVSEYRANYEEGLDCAKYAHSILNMMIDDDTNTKMGDWLLDATKTRDDYIKLFTQCNSAIFLSVSKALAAACSNNEEASLADLAELDPSDFEGETQYEDTASAIYAGIPAFRALMEPYITSDFYGEDDYDETDMTEEFKNRNEEGKYAWTMSFPLAASLMNIEMGDTNLLDLLLTDLDELTTEDLYPVASLLTPGQAAVVRYSGLQALFSTALMPQDKWSEVDDYLTIDETNPVSVYAGVDRELFEGGVALTSKALVEASSSNDNSWYAGNLDADVEHAMYVIMGTCAGVCAASVLIYLGACKLMDLFGGAVSQMMLDTDVITALNLAVGSGGSEVATAYLADIALLEQLQLYSLYVSQIATYLGWIALGALLIVGAVYLIMEGYSYYHPEFGDIPHMLVSKDYDSEGNTVFVNYRSVRNLNGDTVDYTQFNCRKWIALYTTKDKNAGNPILSTLQTSSKNYLAEWVGVRKFSQDTAFDLAQYSFDIIDGFNFGDRNGDKFPRYLYFKQVADSELTASAITNAGNIVMPIGAFVIGALAGVIVTAFVKRKKTDKAENTEKSE